MEKTCKLSPARVRSTAYLLCPLLDVEVALRSEVSVSERMIWKYEVLKRVKGSKSEEKKKVVYTLQHLGVRRRIGPKQ